MRRLLLVAALAAGSSVLGSVSDAQASSHREAPFVTKNPKIDSTDFYMFRSYEAGHADKVTIIANYLPLQDSYGGPNYFQLDPEALYEIHIDNNGDGGEDLTFQFQFQNTLNAANATLPITLAGGPAKQVNAPLLNIGGVTFEDTSKLQINETFTMNVMTGDRRTGTAVPVAGTFRKPFDFTGTGTFGSIANYETYAAKHAAAFSFGTCTGSQVFVGQRREGFAGNIGPIFDLLQNFAPTKAGFLTTITSGGTTAGRGLQTNKYDTGQLYSKNVTSIAIEVPISCLVKPGGNPIIGGWTSASLRQARVLNPNANYALPAKEGGAWTQVSHLGMPLVNEVVIGVKDKDLFSAVTPKSTAAVADYVTNPTLPALIEVVFGALSPGATAPKSLRADLVKVFATGLTVKTADGADFNINQTSTFAGAGIAAPTGTNSFLPAGVTLPEGVAEYLRLNTAIMPTSYADQVAKTTRGLGALGCFTPARVLDPNATTCDPAGFPNGRRPGDDVLDIALRVVMGALNPDGADAPGHDVPFTDANYNGPEQFDSSFASGTAAGFPYLRTPLGGNQSTAMQP